MPHDLRRGVSAEILSRLRLTCLELPNTREQRACVLTFRLRKDHRAAERARRNPFLRPLE